MMVPTLLRYQHRSFTILGAFKKEAIEYDHVAKVQLERCVRGDSILLTTLNERTGTQNIPFSN